MMHGQTKIKSFPLLRFSFQVGYTLKMKRLWAHVYLDFFRSFMHTTRHCGYSVYCRHILCNNMDVMSFLKCKSF